MYLHVVGALGQAIVVAPSGEHALLCSLATIVFGYVYDQRMTQGEDNSESAWLISVLSPTLSWLEDFDSVEDAMTAWCVCVCV